MANRFYFLSGSAGHTSSAVTPGSPLGTFRANVNSRIGTGSVATPSGTVPFQIKNLLATAGVATMSWFSPPVKEFTLSGSVTCSIWGNEAGNANNATIAFRLWHKSGSFEGTGSETTMMAGIVSSSTEWNGTTPALRSAFATLTTTTFKQGDRIVCRLYASGFGAGGAMGGGSTTIYYGGAVSGSLGDSVLIFGQDIPLKKKIKTSR